MAEPLKIGTRGSKLALFQANLVADTLRVAHPDLVVEIVEITTSGDWKPAAGEVRLVEAEGGKGQFAKEIEQALLNGDIDCGVHSMKDMPSFLPKGLVIDHILPRADVRDAFLSNDVKCIADLPQGAVVGTASLRRQAFVLAQRPDLKVVPLRGNVPTRIRKLREGRVDATLLALSGLQRLRLEGEIASIVAPDDMLPAAGQGAIGVEIREGDMRVSTLLDAIHCKKSGFTVAAERSALQVLDGSCHTPIGAQAILNDVSHMVLKVIVASLDGTQIHEETITGTVNNTQDAVALGLAVGATLKAKVPPALLEQVA